MSKEEIIECRRLMSDVRVDESMMDYILQIVKDTRDNPNIDLGCSPRSALSLMAASRAYAAINGRSFVTPDDVKTVAPSVIRHRIILSAEAELDGLSTDHVVQQTLGKIPIPR